MSRLQRIYSVFEEAIAGIFFFAGVTLIFYGVISRYVFKNPLFWVDEISTYILVWGCILGWSIAQRDGRHIRVSLLYNYMPRKVQHYVSIFASIASILFCLFLTYVGYVLETKYLHTGQRSLNTQFPLWAVYFFVPIASFMLCIRYIEELYHLLKNGGKDRLVAGCGKTEDGQKGVMSHHGGSPTL
ncbi:Tripartite ATP-independent periplasmic transporter DctQ component [Desulfofundulus kuznetsovii DSM 6115]|uniref:Tripartite ATP-independent periplasmic transporter DctQ component n=1 Tax=Desulfofundulus kuznetsovii (strain DSM 6115 / VKM B-1805 / 17) TaxID=760568 RepID=A0AAU8PF29_DESK7|nr:Tripartite ATP-independent periplasmic transporter DctQ component [Desulfofundulus kuznetsovii DSM 6115]